ncbi:type I secretion system permease/ATPase [Dryocola sp. BD626]|uniref:type I secretion system permease/ATPase n=1 Tax=Dryocola sp. BD626 TaxID=3133273 RepID=UPI003F508E07
MNKASTAAIPAPTADGRNSLLKTLLWICKYHGKTISETAFCAGLPLKGEMTVGQGIQALARHGFNAGTVARSAREISPLLLPAVALKNDGQATLILAKEQNQRGEEKLKIASAENNFFAEWVDAETLRESHSGYILLVSKLPAGDNRLGDVTPSPVGHWLWSTLWNYRSFYLNAAFAALLVNVLTLAGTFFTMNVYDRVVPNQAYVTLWSLAIGVGLATCMEFLARNIRAFLVDDAGKKADLVIGSRLFRQVMAMRMEHKPSSAGTFANQMREYESVREFASSATLVTLSDVPFIFLFLMIIFLIGGPLVLVPLALIPLIVIISLLIQWPLAKIMRENLRESSLRQGVLIESIDGLESLKAAGGEGLMQYRWEHYNALLSASSLKSRRYSTLATSAITAFQQIQTVALVCWGVYLIGGGTLSMGALIGCVILSGRVIAPLGQIVGLAVRFQQARAAMTSITAIFDKPVEHDASRSYFSAPTLSGALTLNKVSFAWPALEGVQSDPVLVNLSLAIRPGERIAILGKIGSGKSTLLRLMAGLYQPTEGQILLDGLDARQIAPSDWRQAVGFVGQDARLFHGTLRDNICIGRPNCTGEELLNVARLTGLDGLAMRHPQGYDMPIGERGAGLSGGQQQLVVLARCLLSQPALLLMDEPTSAMDTQTEKAFLDRLAQATRRQTLVVVTHRYSLLEGVDRIIVMDDGKIMLDGPKQDVLAALTRSGS